MGMTVEIQRDTGRFVYGNHYLYYYREDYRREWEERITHDARGIDPRRSMRSQGTFRFRASFARSGMWKHS